MKRYDILTLEFAKGLAQDVGKIIRSNMNSLNWTKTKSGFYDIVTNVDVEIERMVKESVLSAFPNDSILGEETGTTKSSTSGKRLWVIDPIDGTTNFSKGIPHSCVSIAVVEENKPQIAVVYDPFMNELFEAVRGYGAKMNGAEIHVSDVSDLEHAIINTGYQYSAEKMREKVLKDYEAFFGRVRAIRVFGSAVLDQCYVAVGRIDAFWEYSLKPWDVAAGSLIAKEAGAVVTGIGEEFSIYSNSILATNSTLLPKIMKVLTNT